VPHKNLRAPLNFTPQIHPLRLRIRKDMRIRLDPVSAPLAQSPRSHVQKHIVTAVVRVESDQAGRTARNELGSAGSGGRCDERGLGCGSGGGGEMKVEGFDFYVHGEGASSLTLAGGAMAAVDCEGGSGHGVWGEWSGISGCSCAARLVWMFAFVIAAQRTSDGFAGAVASERLEFGWNRRSHLEFSWISAEEDLCWAEIWDKEVGGGLCNYHRGCG